MKSITILNVKGADYVIIQYSDMRAIAIKVDKGTVAIPENRIDLGEIADIDNLYVQSGIIAKLDPVY